MAEAASAHRVAPATKQDNALQRAGRMRRTSADPQRTQQTPTGAATAASAARDSLSRLQQLADTSPRVAQLQRLQVLADSSPQVAQLRRLQALADKHHAPMSKLAGIPEEKELVQGQFAAAGLQPQLQQAPRANNTGLPDQLKSGIESLADLSMDHVRVHYNSAQPAQLNALAYAQGSDIHLAPGQERHLPHEAWHVVQQAQGRVRPTLQMKDGVPVNDDVGLEREADVMGERALTQAVQRSENVTPIQRAGLDQIGKSRVVQMKDPRSKNPHNPQTGVTSHHIIPHELLGKILDKFTKDGRKDEITRIFLPDFGTLNLANFVAQVAVKVEYDGQSPNKVTELPEEIATKPFGKFTAEEQGKTSFKVEDAGPITWGKFQSLYKQLKEGEKPQNDSGEAVTGLRDIGESFFEWQSGNLFYGPERIEPGKKDGFDYDAKLIYGESFANQMEAIYLELRKLQAKDDAQSKILMKQELEKMAALTSGVGIPKFNSKIWLPIDTDAKKTVHDIMLPGRGETSKKGLSIHREVLSSAIRNYCDDKTRVHNLYSFKKSVPADISAERIFSADRKALWLRDAPEIKTHMSFMRIMKNFKDYMIEMLNKLFGL